MSNEQPTYFGLRAAKLQEIGYCSTIPPQQSAWNAAFDVVGFMETRAASREAPCCSGAARIVAAGSRAHSLVVVRIDGHRD